ncbi:hypothetical protein H2508_00710 [Parahaliea sp. F7430]|uniref:Phosphate-selective porin O/P n=1 Tax=Sediminihaliea albiluteola TaxID=2758564 RepID=A0A7W2TTP0_9GAMM|nr:porin [Sediminihaliea albiluteola]MBA6411640.1 hypothetical protein [Sediminihaliea albiluteola]
MSKNKVSPLPLLCLVALCSSAGAAEPSVNALKEEIATLKDRLEKLEQLVLQLSTEPAYSSVPLQAEHSALESAAVEPSTAETEPATKHIDIGGALRFNLVYRDDVEDSVGKRGESGLDIFRLNIDGAINNILLSAEYRFYSYMSTLRYGWLGYQFADDSQIQVGISQVPFGLLPYAAHNSWFGLPYYLGLSDDYDMGLKYERQDGPWSSQLAFYKNEELNDSSSAKRYAFDLVRSGDQQNEEINQINARLAYTFGLGSNCETEVGASYETGQVYNTVSKKRGKHRAAALHLDSRCGRWNLQLQGTRYDYDVANPLGVDDSVVRMGAFAGTYDIASDADIWVANLAYNFSSPWKHIDSITCYNDYSRLDKDLSGATDSQINTLGCAIGSGPIFTYLDYIVAKNMPYFGNGSLGHGGNDDWQSRLNINIGYYW